MVMKDPPVFVYISFVTGWPLCYWPCQFGDTEAQVQHCTFPVSPQSGRGDVSAGYSFLGTGIESQLQATVSSTCTAVSVSPQTENLTLGCMLHSLVSVSYSLSSVNVCFQEGQAPLWQ